MAKKTKNGAGPRSRLAQTNILLKQNLNTSPVRKYGKNGVPLSRNGTRIISFSERDKVALLDLDGCPLE